MRVLAIDVGGTNVKVLLSGQEVPRKAPSGPTMTPHDMGVRALRRLGTNANAFVGGFRLWDERQDQAKKPENKKAPSGRSARTPRAKARRESEPASAA